MHDGAGDRAPALLGRDREVDPGLVVGHAFVGFLGHRDILFPGDMGRVDRIHPLVKRRQQPGEQRCGQRAGVEFCRLALVADLHIDQRALGDLSGEAAELARQFDIGAQPEGFLGRHRRHVDRIGNRAVQQIFGNLFGDLNGDILLRLFGRRAEMRRRDDLVGAEERIVFRRFDFEHVEGGPGDMAVVQRRLERVLVDQPAAGAVDDPHARLHPADRGGVDHVAGAVDKRRVQRNEVGAPYQVVEFDLLDAHFPGALRRQERVAGDHLHLQAAAPFGDVRPDVAAPDDPQHLAGQLHAHEAGFLPFPGLGAQVGGGNLPGEREHQRNGVLGGGDRIAERRVHHQHALRGRRGDIDIVDADAGPADDLQPCRRIEDFAGHAGGRPDGQPVIRADDALQFVRRHARFDIRIDPVLAEDFRRARAHLVRDQHLRRIRGRI